jgi:hypothetical protein
VLWRLLRRVRLLPVLLFWRTLLLVALACWRVVGRAAPQACVGWGLLLSSEPPHLRCEGVRGKSPPTRVSVTGFLSSTGMTGVGPAFTHQTLTHPNPSFEPFVFPPRSLRLCRMVAAAEASALSELEAVRSVGSLAHLHALAALGALLVPDAPVDSELMHARA